MAAPRTTQISTLRNIARSSSRQPIRTRPFTTSQAPQAAMRAPSTTTTTGMDSITLPNTAIPEPDPYTHIRVPILPSIEAVARLPEALDPEVMKPQISSVSADAVVLPMSDLSDGHAMQIDFHAMADRVAVNLRRISVPVEQQAGLIKQIWNDMVDDMVGLSGNSSNSNSK